MIPRKFFPETWSIVGYMFLEPVHMEAGDPGKVKYLPYPW